MPLLLKQSIRSQEPAALTFQALNGVDDAFSYSTGDEVIVFHNTGDDEATVVLLGNNATTVVRSGISQIDVSGGKSVTIPSKEYAKVTLKDCQAFLNDSDNKPVINNGSAEIFAAHLTL